MGTEKNGDFEVDWDRGPRTHRESDQLGEKVSSDGPKGARYGGKARTQIDSTQAEREPGSGDRKSEIEMSLK